MFRSKLLLITSLVAVASFIAAGTAAADVPRYQPTPTSATFTITSPMAPGDWGHLWIQDYTVTVNANGTFSGTGHVYNSFNSTTVMRTSPARSPRRRSASTQCALTASSAH